MQNVDMSTTTPKYVLVTGGTISGIGKSCLTGAIGTLLKASGLNVVAMKINPAFNIDAKNVDLYSHKEIFILDDGGQVERDLGLFERFLDINLGSDHLISTGKLFKHIIQKEDMDQYDGQTVELTTHITNEIHEWIKRVATSALTRNGDLPHVCIIELGGLVGDAEVVPYLEAFRQFQHLIGSKNFCCIHVTWVPKPSIISEHKTKPTQTSIGQLLSAGLTPDIIICRSEVKITKDIKAKVAKYAPLLMDQVLNVPILPSIYHIPPYLKNHNLHEFLCKRLALSAPSQRPKRLITSWNDLSKMSERVSKIITVALIGKYTKTDDSYLSLRHALEHAALACDVKMNIEPIYAEDLEQETKVKQPDVFYKAWGSLCKADGVVVPGGRGARGIEGKIAAIQWTRSFRKPFLGIGLGFHCTVVEFSRSILNWEDANTMEASKETNRSVIIHMPDVNSIAENGMKAGKAQSVFTHKKSIVKSLYGKDIIEERHCHEYDVNPDHLLELESAGMHFVAKDPSGTRVDILELTDLPYFVAVQFHPEYTSRPLRPSPPILGLVLAICGKLENIPNKNFPQCYSCDENLIAEETDINLGQGDMDLSGPGLH